MTDSVTTQPLSSETQPSESPMHDARTHDNGLGAATKHVAEHASAIARLELELAALELKKKLASLGLGIGLGIGALVFSLYMLGFLFATIAAAFATFLSTWLALLIVTLILLVVTGVLGVLALGKIKQGTPPVPQQAIREAKLTSDALKR